jgi:hypothetical protein
MATIAQPRRGWGSPSSIGIDSISRAGKTTGAPDWQDVERRAKRPQADRLV